MDVEGITEALEEGAHVRRGHARAVRVPKSLEDRNRGKMPMDVRSVAKRRLLKRS